MTYLFSPLDSRYQKDLPYSLSEEANLEAQIDFEKAYLLALMTEGLCPRIDEKELDTILQGLSFAEVEEIEKTTQHATRALVEAISLRLRKAGHPKASDWVHVGVTSFDTVDSAARIRLQRFFVKDLFPELDRLAKELKRWAVLHAETPQVGRTHGQWAVPTVFGLTFAEANERLEDLMVRLRASVVNLRGQCSGAIGGYHALGLLVKDPLKFESKFLKTLGLIPHMGSTQILPPEDISSLAGEVFHAMSVVAKLATDLRHLARSEIAEVAEGMAPGQVGSSTMPQKRNPWNLEHVCSLYKVLQSKLTLFQIDLVSEHQRDLTNSASGRFYVEFFAVAFLMTKRLSKVLSRMEVSPAQMKLHLDNAGSSVYAEAFYVLATKHGTSDAHSQIREASRESEKSGKSLMEVAIARGLLPKTLDFEALKKEVWRGPQNKMQTFLRIWNAKGHG